MVVGRWSSTRNYQLSTRSSHRQAEIEGRAFPHLALYPDASAMAGDYLRANIKSKAKAWVRVRLEEGLSALSGWNARPVHLEEAVEDFVLLVPGDAYTEVLHADHDLSLLLVQPGAHNYFVGIR